MRNFEEHREDTNLAGASEVRPFPSERTEEEAAGRGLSLAPSAHSRERWNEIQSHFVDDPQGAVQEADQLVASASEQLTALIEGDRSGLGQGWRSQDGASTEDLRLAIQGYRDLFDRLSRMETTWREAR